jgi:hypothetical protein
MKLLQTIALGFAAMALWNCTETTQPETRQVDPKVPYIANAVANYAAYSAGYSIVKDATQGSAALVDTGDSDPFGPEGLKVLAEIGLCPNLILIVEELFQNIRAAGPNPQSIDPFAASPHLLEAAQCLESKAKGFSAAAPPDQAAVMSVVDECLCAGGGSIFAGFAFSVYGPPGVVGGRGYSEPVINATPYSPPTLPGYSQPATIGEGYQAPSL